MIELTETTSSAIASEFVKARRRAGSPAMGMVMTLVIVAPEEDAAEAMAAAKRASREHPSRVLGVILGDPPLFPQHEEVELSWKILDPIVEYWAARGKPDTYEAGTWGPASADRMLARDGRVWRRP